MLKNSCVLTIFLANLALMGCGTKGPLYIPEQRYPQKETAPQANTDAAPQPASKTSN